MNSMMFVGRNYDMDPETEDLLPDGSYLKNGMVVLAEDNLLRGNPDSTMSYEIDRVKENNRWCEVSHVSQNTSRYDGHPNTIVSFIATYADGTKRKRSYNVSYAWFVKKDSLPKSD